MLRLPSLEVLCELCVEIGDATVETLGKHPGRIALPDVCQIEHELLVGDGWAVEHEMRPGPREAILGGSGQLR